MPKGGKRPGAGRPRGSRNVKLIEIERRIEAIGFDPMLAMAEIAVEARADGDLKLAGDLFARLTEYVYPKRRAIEVEGQLNVNGDLGERLDRANARVAAMRRQHQAKEGDEGIERLY